MTSSRVLVIQKRPNLPTLYFGPFVSETMASRFIYEQMNAELAQLAEIKPLLGRSKSA